jgi:hypothetical protein
VGSVAAMGSSGELPAESMSRSTHHCYCSTTHWEKGERRAALVALRPNTGRRAAIFIGIDSTQGGSGGSVDSKHIGS